MNEMVHYIGEFESGSDVSFNYIVGPVEAANPSHAAIKMMDDAKDLELVSIYSVGSDAYGRVEAIDPDSLSEVSGVVR